MKYKPGKFFSGFFNTDLGKGIIRYLITTKAKERMILTTELGHPAAEGIGDILLERFGDEVKNNQAKQATGHLIKTIMEHEGFHVAQRSVRCRKKTEVFSFASRYEKNK